eukprot:COSAG01_NODE_1495_length_10123_cov_6.359537_5_plen_75_part_00
MLQSSAGVKFAGVARIVPLWVSGPVQLYKVQQFRCYRSGLRRLLLVGEYGGRQTDSSRQQQTAGCGWPVAAAAD